MSDTTEGTRDIAPGMTVNEIIAAHPDTVAVFKRLGIDTCCGGAHTLSDSDTSTKLVLNILQAAEASGAEVIATECPTCHTGREMHQVRAEKRFGKKTNVKVLYFTQLLGLALGIGPRALGIHTNISDSMDLIIEKRLT